MLSQKAKEQLIAIITLSSIFIFFVYLKLNPEVNNTKMLSDVTQENQLISEKKIIDNSVKELIEISVKDDKETKKESLILFTEKEFRRAQSYLSRDWRPDETINMSAWDYILNNPDTDYISNKTDSIQLVNITDWDINFYEGVMGPYSFVKN